MGAGKSPHNLKEMYQKMKLEDELMELKQKYARGEGSAETGKRIVEIELILANILYYE